MLLQEFEENWRIFLQHIETISANEDKSMSHFAKQYIEQNLIILNSALTASIENIQQVQKLNSLNDLICIQAKLTHDINKKLSLSTQRFLNASLGHVIDYNEWLKAHCDLATD